MPSLTMRTTVLQATTISIICTIFNHHLGDKMFDPLWENEAFVNMTNALNSSQPLNSTRGTPGRLTLDAGNTTSLNNGTAINGTLSAIKSPPESFYGRTLPRDAVIILLLSALQYWWFIWLEKMLPARPRYRDAPYRRKEKVEESEDREEEIVEKWIAQGRIRRASLNWCNTFLKWLLELTVGRLWYYVVGHMIEALLKLESPKKVLKGLTSVSRLSPVLLL